MEPNYGTKINPNESNRELSNLQQHVESVTFKVGHRCYTKSGVENLSLLHYRHLDKERARNSRHGSRSLFDYAEILIYYDDKDQITPADITRNLLQRK